MSSTLCTRPPSWQLCLAYLLRWRTTHVYIYMVEILILCLVVASTLYFFVYILINYSIGKRF